MAKWLVVTAIGASGVFAFASAFLLIVERLEIDNF